MPDFSDNSEPRDEATLFWAQMVYSHQFILLSIHYVLLRFINRVLSLEQLRIKSM